MVKVEHTVVIDRPVSEVFAYLTDLGNLPTWQSTLVEVDRKPGEDAAVGATVTEVRDVFGRRVESRLEVTENERDRRFSLRTVSGPFPFRVAHTFEEADGGTRIRFVGEGEPRGLLRFSQGLVERNVREQTEADFATLKRILESGPSR